MTDPLSRFLQGCPCPRTLLAASLLLGLASCGFVQDQRVPPAIAPTYSLPVDSFELAVLVDQSGSMLRTDPAARRSDVAAFLLESLGALEAAPGKPNRAVVVHFGSRVCSEGAPAECAKVIELTDTAATRDRVQAVVRAQAPRAIENTNIVEALAAARDALASGREPGVNFRRVFVILTDGLPDPDGKTKAEGLPAQFDKIRDVWTSMNAQEAGQLHVLGLDATGEVFTEQVIKSWSEVGHTRDKGDVSVARVETLDAMLDQGARLIADLTGPSGSAPRTLQEQIRLEVEPWRARLDLWFLGQDVGTVPELRAPDGKALDALGARVVRGNNFSLVRVDDPASGTWLIGPAGAASTRVLARSVPHELRLLSPHSVAEGDTRPIIAVFQRVDGTPIRDASGAKVPLSFRAKISDPPGQAFREFGFREEAEGRFVSEELLTFGASGEWVIEFTTLSDAGAGAGKVTRWSSTARIQVMRKPRVVLAAAEAKVWRWPMTCRFDLAARVVDGAEARALKQDELSSLGSLGDLLLLDGVGYLSYDAGLSAFVRTLECPTDGDRFDGELALMVGANQKEFLPERFPVTVKVATSLWYFVLTILAALLAIYLLLVVAVLMRSGKPCSATIEILKDMTVELTWNVNGSWSKHPSLPFTAVCERKDPTKGAIFIIHQGTHLSAALRLGSGGHRLTEATEVKLAGRTLRLQKSR